MLTLVCITMIPTHASRRRLAWRCLLICLLAGLGLPAQGQSTAYTDIVVFGDSLSDVGNTANNAVISFFSPQARPPYYQGRFSNGPVWIETLANRLGLNASTRSSAGGLNFAEGGALSGNGTTYLGLIDNVGNQVNSYLGSNAVTGNELHVLWAGGNDLIDLGSLSNGDSDPAVVASNTAGHVQTLINNGARNFLVVNLPDLGAIPRTLGTADAPNKTAASQTHNALLTQQLNLLGTTPGVDIDLLDVFSLFEQIAADPLRYGFANVTDPAYNASAGTVVSEPNTYAFWDDIHPTAAAHDWVAAAGYIALQETGDFTGDGNVDDADLAIVLGNYGSTVNPFDLAAGDWTGDGRVDHRELHLVLRNWSSGTAPTIDVPEPGALVMLTIAWGAVSRRRRSAA